MPSRNDTDRNVQSLLEEIDRLQRENRRLRLQLETPQRNHPEAQSSTRELSQERKVSLFRSLFRGREDVYAVRWDSEKTGKAGYSPSRRHRTSSATEDEFLPLTDQVIRAHLQGQQTLGVYPLLTDETCWFVAVDFDKTTWCEDCAAFRKVGQELGIDVALERSRSGNGAHAWVFFEKPLEARLARHLATALLTRTMKTNYQLGLDSYDRVFPSQDTLPKGGFGNLIALPLQGQSRRLGTQFS